MSHTGPKAMDINAKRLGLEILPNEIILNVSQYLTAGATNSLIQTNHFFQSLLAPLLEDFLSSMSFGTLTKLSWAAANGYDRLVLRLLKMGVKPNERGVKKPYWTALQHAAMRGNLEIVNLLLKFGVDPNARQYGQLNWHIPSPNLETGTGTALHIAARCGHTSIVRALVEHGADVNAFGTWWNTAIHSAITLNDARKMFHLYTNDHVLSWDGMPRQATEQELCDIISILLENGAQVNYYMYNKAPLLCAILRRVERKSDLSIIKLLLNAGADLCAPHNDWNRMTPLHSAVMLNQPDIVRLLLEAGADVNAKLRSNSATPLACAIRSNFQTTMEILLEYGGEIGEGIVYGGD